MMILERYLYRIFAVESWFNIMVMQCKYIQSVSVLFIMIVIDIAIHSSINNRVQSTLSEPPLPPQLDQKVNLCSAPLLLATSSGRLSPEDSRQSVQYYVNVSSSSGSSRRGPERSLMENKVRNVDINLAAGLACFYTFCGSSFIFSSTERDSRGWCRLTSQSPCEPLTPHSHSHYYGSLKVPY